MSDRIRTAPDVSFRPVGMGTSTTFMCARCAKPRLSQGRKLQRVQGLRTWVCKGCAK